MIQGFVSLPICAHYLEFFFISPGGVSFMDFYDSHPALKKKDDHETVQMPY